MGGGWVIVGGGGWWMGGDLRWARVVVGGARVTCPYARG